MRTQPYCCNDNCTNSYNKEPTNNNKRIYSSSERLKALHKTYKQNLPTQKNMSCPTNKCAANCCTDNPDNAEKTPTLAGKYSKPIDKTRYALNSSRRINNDCNNICANYPNIPAKSSSGSRTFALRQIHKSVTKEAKVVESKGMWYSKCSREGKSKELCAKRNLCN